MAVAEKIAPGLRSMAVPVGELAEDPANARKHDARNIESIKASLQRFGQQKPIVVSKGRVVAGNGTLVAAKALGWKKVAVTDTNLKGTAAKAYAIADNRTSELAEWDDFQLADTLAELRLEDPDLVVGAGFSMAEYALLVQEPIETADPGNEAFRAPNVQEAAEGYLAASIRQIVLHLEGDEYEEAIVALQAIREKESLETNTDAVLWLINLWKQSN